ncbi:hypothetical protein HOLleu_29558 [Holothuria leucospilota]|uniref:Uncharacterized protein n=1 Tax=Holothuria leucospilota TaxID=206669 RepID=A0A9Q1BNQ8_HOLLE|nr:hypothetical protein HOLleu_29558 [Holothuria leucospilota]
MDDNEGITQTVLNKTEFMNKEEETMGSPSETAVIQNMNTALKENTGFSRDGGNVKQITMENDAGSSKPGYIDVGPCSQIQNVGTMQTCQPPQKSSVLKEVHPDEPPTYQDTVKNLVPVKPYSIDGLLLFI